MLDLRVSAVRRARSIRALGASAIETVRVESKMIIGWRKQTVVIEKSDTLKRDAQEQNDNLKHEEALKALRRLREIGENLPTVDAVVVIRGGRNLTGQDSR